MFEMRPIEDAIRVAEVGGGFTMDASMKRTDDLVRIATAASNNSARVTFTGLETRQTADLVRIAVAGKGAVCFG
jgi:hypothetical protein